MRRAMMRSFRALAVLACALWPAVVLAQAARPEPQAGGTSTQPPAPQPPPDEPAQPAAESLSDIAKVRWVTAVDFGVRGSRVDGDRGRFERYRDLGDGLFLERLRLNRERGGYLLAIEGDHVGRRDQRYVGSVTRPGKLRGSFMWDQIPMLLSEQTRSLFSGIGSGVLSIDDQIQALGQASPASITDIFKQSSVAFVTRTRRHIADGRVQYFPSESVTVQANVRHTDREGTIPYGGSFGHSSLVELPAPTNHTLSDIDASAEYARNPVLLRGGYSGSWFRNDVTSLVFDNPFRLTDLAATPARGRLSLPPSNSFISVNGLASLRLPYKSRVTAHASIGTLQDAGQPLLPQTINPAIATQPLERSTVEGEARLSSVNLNFVSRPVRALDLTMRFRSFDYANRTPEFRITERVSYDNTPAALPQPLAAEQFSVQRHNFDADLRYFATGRTSAGIGFSRLGEERSHRIFESTADNQLRLTFDASSQRWFSLRTKYEHARRRGEGIEEGIQELVAIGEQPGLRHFDIANRNRDRITILGSITPLGFLTTSVSIAAGKDDYLHSEFGLRDNTHRIYSAGADLLGGDRVTVGASYSFEEYNALQRSRQANPGAQFTDPSRNWAADTTDRTHSLTANASVTRIANRIDLGLSYDFTRGRAIYTYITGPITDRTLPEEVVVETTLPPPSQLPPTFSQLNRGTVDLTYALTRRLAIGASYWYEQYRVRDFTLDIDANPDLVRGQALLIGYLYRPYTANTGWLRLLYRW
jgi:MtrB/PioB family decaheme-associated outer membrane protein